MRMHHCLVYASLCTTPVVVVGVGALFLFIAATAFVVEAQQSDVPDEPGERDEREALLAWSFAEGDVFFMRETQVHKQTQEIAGQRQTTTTHATDFLRFAVAEVDADENVAALELTFIAASIVVQSEFETFEYDSRNPEHEELAALPEVAPIAGRLGKSVRFTVDREGRVSEVVGYEDLFTEWLDQMRGRDPDVAPIVDMYAALYSNEAFGRQMEATFRLVPGRFVRVGDSWEVDTQEMLPGLGTLSIEWRVAYSGMHQGKAALDVDGSVSLVPSEDEDDDDARRLFGEPLQIGLSDVGVSGSVRFSAEAGRLEAGEIASSFTLTVEFGQEFSLKQTSEVRWAMKRLSAEAFERALALEPAEPNGEE